MSQYSQTHLHRSAGSRKYRISSVICPHPHRCSSLTMSRNATGEEGGESRSLPPCLRSGVSSGDRSNLEVGVLDRTRELTAGGFLDDEGGVRKTDEWGCLGVEVLSISLLGKGNTEFTAVDLDSKARGSFSTDIWVFRGKIVYFKLSRQLLIVPCRITSISSAIRPERWLFRNSLQ